MKAIFTLFMSGAFLILFALGIVSFTYPSKSLDEWVVPEKYKTMKNPYAGEADAEGVGKNLFKTHCASCHGKEGHGDGTKAAQLEEELKDFASK